MTKVTSANPSPPDTSAPISWRIGRVCPYTERVAKVRTLCS
jgi:hypothetical protein